MKFLRRLSYIVPIVLAVLAVSDIAAAQLQPLTLGNADQYNLAPHLFIFRNNGAPLTIDEISQNHTSKIFSPLTNRVLTLSPGQRQIWLKFYLKNDNHDDTRTWIIEAANPNLDEIDLYTPSPENSSYIVQKAGAFRPLLDKSSPNFVFELGSNPVENRPYFIRIKNHAFLSAPLRVWEKNRFNTHTVFDMLMFGVIYGVLLSMILANFFIWLSFKDQAYLFYVLYVFCMLLYQVCLHGQLRMLVDFGPGQTLRLLWYFLGLATVFAFYFCKIFLNTRKNTPLLDKVFTALMILGLVVLLLGLIGHNAAANTVAHVPGVIGPIVSILAGIVCLRQGFRPARFFLIAWSLLLVGVFLFALEGLKVVPHSALSTYTFPVGAALESVLLSFALGDRIRTLRSDRLAAQAASDAKTRFLANMSHEIRTPLNAIIGMTDIMMGTSMSRNQKEYLGTVHDAGHHLLTLVNDVLDFSKIEAGGIELETIDFDLHDLLHSTAGVMAHQAESKGLKLELKLADNVPKMLKGDPNRIRQVLVNLMGNAVKFTSKGGITIRAGRFDHPRNQGRHSDTVWILFSVIDTGLGIKPDVRERIFDSFQQADSSISREYGGAGLGLAISRQLVDMMGGRIWVESDMGKGSTFNYLLPLDRGGPPDQGDTDEKRDALQPVDASYHVLLVDDNEVNAKVGRIMLEKLGHVVETAGDGLGALQKLSREPFDVVLMDLEMPKMDGFEATKAIRGGDFGVLDKSIPIIAMTAHAVIEIRNRCERAGMNAYAVKPINMMELGRTIEKAVSGGGREPSAIEPGPVDTTKVNEDENPEEYPVLDWRSAMVEIGLDEEMFEKVLDASVSEMVELLEKTRVALTEGDYVSAKRHAHTIKGTAAGIGAYSCRQYALSLEKALQAEALETSEPILADLEREYEKLVMALKDAPGENHRA